MLQVLISRPFKCSGNGVTVAEMLRDKLGLELKILFLPERHSGPEQTFNGRTQQAYQGEPEYVVFAAVRLSLRARYLMLLEDIRAKLTE